MAAPPKTLGPAIIELFGVSKSYRLEGEGEVTAIRNVDLAPGAEFGPIRRGEFVMIRGPSGGGETSLLNLVGLIDLPTKGNMRLFNRVIDFASTSDAELARIRLERMGFVFQSFNLLGTLSAYENVELPMSILGRMSGGERAARPTRLLQRVAIARALANEPTVLLLDEPTGDLDTANTVKVMDLLLEINQARGTTMLMVTHDPNLEVYADRVLYVADGQFAGQAINTAQSRLDLPSYVKFLNVADDR